MDRIVGLLGGGRLGQMLCEAASPLGIKVVVLEVENSPVKQVNAKNTHVSGSFTDSEKIRELARQCDVLMVEIEHVDTYVLEEVAKQGVEILVDGKITKKKVEVQPSWRTIRIIQDKYEQKRHLEKYDVPVARSTSLESTSQDLAGFGDQFGYPYMLKARKKAYVGPGNYPIMAPSDIDDALHVLGNRPLYAEKWAEFKMELAVMVVKIVEGTNVGGSTIAYPAIELVHEDSVCKLVYAPARGLTPQLRSRAQRIARKAVSSFWGKGVFGVEMFLLADGRSISSIDR